MTGIFTDLDRDVRTDSLDRAIAHHARLGSAPTPEQIIATASKFEDYLRNGFRGGVSAPAV